jgi:hypothetical protein
MWVKLDDGFARHPKLRRLSDAAFRVHVSALCYAAEFLTDGRIPTQALGELKASRKVMEELVAARLWERDGEDFQIHDYFDWNRPAETVKAERAKKAAGGRTGAEKRWRPHFRVADDLTEPKAYPIDDRSLKSD